MRKQDLLLPAAVPVLVLSWFVIRWALIRAASALGPYFLLAIVAIT